MKIRIDFRILIIGALLLMGFAATAQDKVIKDTTISGFTYKMYQGSRGGHYILIHSKAGKEYKRYFSHPAIDTTKRKG